jgi:hypothetical protein
MKRTPLTRRTPLASLAPLRSRSSLQPSGALRCALRHTLRSVRVEIRRKSKRKTAAEQEHLDLVAALGCLACRLDGFPGTPAEIHHSRLRPDGTPYGAGCRASHFEIAPLCPPHHRGGAKGIPSRHLSEPAFVARYGNDLVLLAHVDRLLHPPREVF